MVVVKAYRGKLSVSIITFVILALAFVAVLVYNETISSLHSSNSLLRLGGKCARKKQHPSPTTSKAVYNNGDHADDQEEDYKLEFDPDICDITDGKWVFNRSVQPLYSDKSCPYVDRQFSCVKNGRPDSDYRYWQWQPEDCTLPRFDPNRALSKLRGKRLMFVGDSLIRSQWESFVCLVEFVIPKEEKTMKRDKVHSVFRAKEYNATVEFYWAPFLVESNSDVRMILDPKQRILKVDSVANHAKHWQEADILVFGTYVWWMSSLKVNAWCGCDCGRWGSFANGDEGYEELDRPVAYRLGLKTWANWVDSTINPNKTRVFFTTLSPTHTRSLDWREDGMKCFNDTQPVKKKGLWGTGSDRAIFKAASEVLGKIKRVPVGVVNVTQISEYRVDAHSSVYTETGGKLLTEEQKRDPLHHADCIHWCLPGVPDTWNQIFLAQLS